MTLEADRLEAIRGNATFVVEQFGPLSDMDFGLDAASVEWIEGFIERQRPNYSSGALSEGIVTALGCYLGEAIIKAAGGEWHEDGDGRLGVCFANDDMCFPFGKVEKQFQQGLECGESVLSFYNVAVHHVAQSGLHRDAASRIDD